MAIYGTTLPADVLQEHLNAIYVPEPATLAVWAGLLGLGLLAWRRERDKTR